MSDTSPRSPITGGKTIKVGVIPTDKITTLYAPYCDVRRFFSNISEVSIYQCLDTGYRFYSPFTVAGDGHFYEELSKEQLYYVSWKAEHQIADNYIHKGDTVLELGCAKGDFLATEIEKKQIRAYGTELNEEAKEIATRRGIQFKPTTDANVTCAFQVLEHIADIREFITTAINATKSGGYIIFGVPNNDSLLKDDTMAFLNMPPHHMGLWNKQSLAALASYFPMEVVDIHEEPLQPNHYRWYYQVYYGNHLLKLGFIGKIVNKLVYELGAKYFIQYKASVLKGHTVVAVYKKK